MRVCSSCCEGECMAVYVVTGGAGFIGSHIVERLVAEGHEVRVVDDLSTGKTGNIAAWFTKVAFFPKDVCDTCALREIFSGADYVLHQAAIPSVPRSVDDPMATNRASVDGTLSVLLAARDAGVRRVIYASSSSVYGDAAASPKVETMPTNPLSPYAVSKLAGECYVRAFSAVYGLETVALRYFNIFGPRQDPNSPYSAAIPKFIQLILAGEAPVVYGDGEQTRDFTYVANAVEANFLACHAPDAPGRVFNVGCGGEISVNDILGMLGDILGVTVEAEFLPPRSGEVRHSRASIDAAAQILGYKPLVEIREGLEKTARWLYGKRDEGDGGSR